MRVNLNERNKVERLEASVSQTTCSCLRNSLGFVLVDEVIERSSPESRQVMEELRAEIRELQDQNRLLLTINEGLTQTHADISFLLTERRNIIAESALNSKVRDLLDKTNGARVSLSNLCTGDSSSCYIPILHLMTKVCICLEQTRLVSISQINIPTLNAVIFSLLVVKIANLSVSVDLVIVVP